MLFRSYYKRLMSSRSKDFSMKHIPPRDYQIELLDHALTKNTIVSLGTGAGKTFVAVLLIKEYSHRLLNNNEKAVFLVNTVPLVEQQASHVEFHSSLRVARMCGGLNRRKYEKSEIDAIMKFHQILVVTAQVYLDLLNHGLLSLSSVALLIVDECHHCLGELHPYRLIMNQYRQIKGEKPRVLGLTASVLNKKMPIRSIEHTVQKLEQIMCAQLETASDYSMVCKYVTKPKKLIVCARKDTANEEFVVQHLEFLRNFVENNCDFQSAMDIDPRKPILDAITRTFTTLWQLGSWCALKGCLLWQKKLHKLKEDPILGTKQQCILRMAETSFRTCSKVLSQKVNTINSLEMLTRPGMLFISDRVHKLLDILRNYSPSKREQAGIKDPLSGLIFVNERFIAFMINTLLKFLVKLCPEEFGHIKVDFLVGHTGNSETEDEDRRLANKKQEQTLHKFRNGQLNLLVATNVLEEGIDIRNCNLVIRFDPPADFRSYIQSSGRARKENSAFYVIVEDTNYLGFMNDLITYSQTEEFILRRYRSGNELPAAVEEEEQLIVDIDNLVEPYVVDSTKARVALSGAIQLINRYCSKLPSDVFTRLVPHYAIRAMEQEGRKMFCAELILPINSPVKESITTRPLFPSKTLALKAVALEACKRLHERKELNDQLLPTGKEIVTDFFGELDDEEFLPYLLNKIGSSKRKRLYDRKMSKALTKNLPALESECLIYIVEMKLVKPISEENNPKKRRIIDPFETNYAFGFLSSRELPTIPGFPVFQRQGEMMVRIRKARCPLRLTFELYQLICLFQQHLFEDILRIARGGVMFAPPHSPIPLLIIPLKRDGPTDLDYRLDPSYLSWDIREPPTIPTDEIRKEFQFDESRYTNAVVMPWYRSEDQCAFYFVAEILRDQSPKSAFPDSKFTNFNEYFNNKYHLQIYNQQQHLLDVDHTSARMNLLLPRATMGKTAKRPLDPSQRQILVPELVHIHSLSAPLWTMIVALPTVLYRVNALLLADEFRLKVMEDALKLDAKTPAGFEWSPLYYVTQNSDQTQQQIKNLDQLKRINQEEKISDNCGWETARTLSADYELEDTSLDDVEKDGFEIGVWDPSDGTDFGGGEQPMPAIVPTTPVQQNGIIPPRNGLRLNAAREEEISELIAIGNDTTIHSYGDISDDEDIAEYDNFKFLMHNKMTSDDLGDVECSDVRPIGWNDDEDLATNIIQIENENLPLTISCNNPHINIVSLMNDLEKNYAGLGAPVAPTTTTNVVNSTKQVPAVAAKPNQNQQQQATYLKKQLHLDPLQAMDEVDRTESIKRSEEVLSEDFYEDGTVDEPSQPIDGSNLVVDQLLTKVPDFPDNLCGRAEIQKFEILAPPLPPMPFSFMRNFLTNNPYGVSPALLLQALTTSSAADGINLERLETIGDSFLKMAVTNYLYHKHVEQHEGKLSFARSKEVSNSRLFLLGRQRGIPVLMETLKFDPHVNWLPPCYASTSEFHAVNPLDHSDLVEEQTQMAADGDKENASLAAELRMLKEKDDKESGWGALDDENQHYKCENGIETITFPQQTNSDIPDLPPMPYNMLTQQWISDKSIADAVEALIGAHLIQLGQEAALKFMNWLGIKVLTETPTILSPLLRFIDTPEDPNLSLKTLTLIYNKFDFDTVERTIGYKFANKAYLIQAFTHASYFNNRVTGCYQRLEFLGDAILDYMITRFLFEHKKQYSPGVLTDLRSALVNNTIFASLAVKYNFHKHFVMLCPPLYQMIEKFVNFCKLKDFSHCANFDDEIFMITEEEIDEGHEEDVEVPKAMGDIFESVAGAVYLDCGMDLDIVWRVFYNLMRDVIEKCCENPPQSPVRELFERKNCRAKFAKLERKLETGKVRVTVTVNDLQFTGMGRSYRIAKCTAAKRALQHLRKLDLAKEKSRKEKEAAAAATTS